MHVVCVGGPADRTAKWLPDGQASFAVLSRQPVSRVRSEGMRSDVEQPVAEVCRYVVHSFDVLDARDSRPAFHIACPENMSTAGAMRILLETYLRDEN